MYEKGIAGLNVATGVAILPETGSNRSLFIVAASLMAVGVAVFIVSTVMARKSRSNEAK